MSRILVALGGNALARPGGDGSWEEARRQMRAVAPTLAKLVAEGGELLLTHGNGPQVGRLLRQEELAEREVAFLPIDVLVAESEGQIGYLIQQELSPALERAGAGRAIVAIVSRVEVSRKDPAFREPIKPIGRFYSDSEARLLRKQKGWAMAYDGARGGWRRLLPSPRPIRWLESEPVRDLVERGWGKRCVIIVAGGGGVPVIAKGSGRYEGVDAVIDKDLTAAMVARELGADTFAIVTDVPAVAIGFRKPWERWVGETTVPELESALANGEFGEGSMAPKVEAVLEFLNGGGRRAIISDIPSLGRALRGEAGTRITRD